MGSARESVAFHLSGYYQRLRGKRPDELVVDPVCYMQVDPHRAAGTARHDDEQFFFCSSRCVRRFESDPGRFLSASEQKK